jgi:hypothetical protein
MRARLHVASAAADVVTPAAIALCISLDPRDINTHTLDRK